MQDLPLRIIQNFDKLIHIHRPPTTHGSKMNQRVIDGLIFALLIIVWDAFKCIGLSMMEIVFFFS